MKKLVNICLSIGLVVFSTYSHGYGIQDLMQESENVRLGENYAYTSNISAQGRGLFAGGRATIRTGIKNFNLIRFEPPSIKAGCGGIDIYLGAFGFADKEEFIQALRAIAQNAAGYAFKLAINTLCPSCGLIMAEIQKIINKLNQWTKDSCSAAKALVSATGVKKLIEGIGNNQYLKAANKGVLGFFEGKNRFLDNLSEPGDVGAAAAGGNPENDPTYGNILKLSFEDSGLSSWTTGGTGNMLEIIQSVIGSLIIKPSSGCTDKDDNTACNPSTTFVEPTLNFDDFMKGSGTGTFNIQKCTDDKCTKITKTAVSGIKGFEQTVKEILIGSSGSAGLLAKLRTRSPGALTADEKALASQTNVPIIAMLMKAAPYQGMANSIVLDSTDTIARAIAVDIITGLVGKAYSVTQAAGINGSEAQLAAMNNNLNHIIDQKRDLRAKLSDTATLLKDFTLRMGSVRSNLMAVSSNNYK